MSGIEVRTVVDVMSRQRRICSYYDVYIAWRDGRPYADHLMARLGNDAKGLREYCQRRCGPIATLPGWRVDWPAESTEDLARACRMWSEQHRDPPGWRAPPDRESKLKGLSDNCVMTAREARESAGAD